MLKPVLKLFNNNNNSRARC